MGVVQVAGSLAVPEPVLPPGEPVSDHMGHSWVGWDGSQWELCSHLSGVWLMAGVRGLTMPAVDHYVSESAAVAGARWRGSRTTAREVFWPLKVWNNAGSQEWVEYDRAWWKTMHPDKQGTWTVTQPNGEARSLRLRFIDDSDAQIFTDPTLTGWQKYGLTLVAEDPYWAGRPTVRSWAAGDAEPFFPGPPFTISAGHTLASATLDNPGDVESWPTWTLTGPFTGASVGLAGSVVEVPFALLEGESLVIDTDPRAQTAIDGDGVDRTSELGAVGFVPVPAGEAVPLELELTGAGSVTVSLTPLWFRAW